MAVEWGKPLLGSVTLYDASALPRSIVGKWVYPEAEDSRAAWHWYDAFHDSYQYAQMLPPDFPYPPPEFPPMPPTPATNWYDVLTTKTFWAALGLLITALIAAGQTIFVDKKPPDFNALMAAFMAFIAIFQRMGILKAEAAAKG